MNIIINLKFILVAIILLSLSGCGGSTSEEAPQTIPKLSYQALPSTLTAEPGETVNLTLNLTGDNAEEIKFNWQVGNDISFTGQGSDSISFTVPTVKELNSIYVNVSLEDSTKVIGFVDQTTFVTVAKVVTEENINSISTSDLDPVTTLNYDGVIEGSSWYLEQVQLNNTENADGTSTSVSTQKLSLVNIEAVNISTHEITISECGLLDTGNIQIEKFAIDTDCGNEDSTLSIKQKEQQFSIERYCGETLVSLNTLSKISNDRLTSNGELLVNFSSYENIEPPSDACGTIATSQVKSYDANGTLSAVAEASLIRLFTSYQGNPFELKFLLDRLPNELFHSLNTSPLNSNYAQINSSVLPEISNLMESGFGSIIFGFNNTEKDIKANFDFDLSPSTGQLESIDGSFTLSF